MKKFHWIIVLLALLMVSTTASAAKLYKWVDEYGNVSYRDTPSVEEGVNYEETNISGGSAADGGASEETAAAAQRSPVVLYSTPNCSACISARAYMKTRGVPFEEKNVQDNGKLQQELKTKSGAISVPTIIIGEKVMNGYVQSLLESELVAAGYPKVDNNSGEAPAADAGSAATPN